MSFLGVDAFSRIDAASRESLTQGNRQTNLAAQTLSCTCRPQVSSVLHAPLTLQRFGSLYTASKQLATAPTSLLALLGRLESCWLQRGNLAAHMATLAGSRA